MQAQNGKGFKRQKHNPIAIGYMAADAVGNLSPAQ